MENELVQQLEAAHEAADACDVEGGLEEDRCLEALNRLEQIPVSYQVLLSTQAWRGVSGLKKHSSSKIKVLAGEVLELWTEIVAKEYYETGGRMRNKKNGEVKSEGSAKVEKMKSGKVGGMTTLKPERVILNRKLRSSKINKKIKTD